MADTEGFPRRQRTGTLFKATAASRRERLDKSKGVKADEDAKKREVRKRDKVCRRPNCPNCKEYRGRLALHCGHLTPKGMGGDPKARVTQVHLMILLDSISHQEQERGELDIVPQTMKGASGLCKFYLVAGKERLYLGES